MVRDARRRAPHHEGLPSLRCEADTFHNKTKFRVPAAHLRPSFDNQSPSANRGRREDRMLVAPAASCAVKKAHELFTTGSTGATRSSLRNGVNGVVRALPGVRDLIVTVARKSSPCALSTSPGVPGP